MPAQKYIGIMTGNSLDAADAVLIDFAEDPATGNNYRLIDSARRPMPPALAAKLKRIAESQTVNVVELLQTENELTRLCAAAANDLNIADSTDIIAIGCHGQTIAHRPQDGITCQLLNGALLAELTRCDVICDFRSRDVAAGGEGAPLAPLFHQYAFGRHAPCDIVNIGGISNITHLAADGSMTAYDIGPGMMLSDAWYQHHHDSDDSGNNFDTDGKLAAAGTINDAVLQQLLTHPFLHRPPPKSCGREQFALSHFTEQLAGLSAADGQATLLAYTAECIRRHLRADTVLVCGGGSRNPALMQHLQNRRPNTATTDTLGIAPEHIEAAAFAYLAKCHHSKTLIPTATLTGAPPHLPGTRHYAQSA